MGQLTQIAVIKMLLDSCAAVCVGPTMALTHENLMLEKSKCRIITADGSIVDVDGTLGFFFEDPNNDELTVDDDFNILLQMLNGAWFSYLSQQAVGKKFFGVSKWLCRCSE